MTRQKREAMFEVAYDILRKVFRSLCHERKIEEAEELADIMKQIIIFSQKV